jgi:SAM-dependent methyltransferase
VADEIARTVALARGQPLQEEGGQPVPVDITGLREAVRAVYSDVARDPKQPYHFHTGPTYAIEQLGYVAADLAELPDSVTAPFAGVGAPLSLGAPRPGQTVLDIGAGSGLDTFLAAKAVGPTGRVIAVDMTPAMVARGRENVALTGLGHVEYREGLAESLPVADASVDLVLSNGVINLCAEKPAVFREAYRVLRPGGRLQIADIVVHRDLPAAARDDIEIWTA